MSSIGLTDVYIRSSQYTPNIGSLAVTSSFFGINRNDIAQSLATDLVTLIATIPEDRGAEAAELIEKYGGKL